MKGILGRKIGMTQVFTKDGKLIPVTVVEVAPNTVMQVKTVESDGYNAIQLGVFEKKEKNATKPEMGRAKKANTTPKRFLKEIRDYEGTYNVGDVIDASTFEVGDVIDVTGIINLVDLKLMVLDIIEDLVQWELCFQKEFLKEKYFLDIWELKQ